MTACLVLAGREMSFPATGAAPPSTVTDRTPEPKRQGKTKRTEGGSGLRDADRDRPSGGVVLERVPEAGAESGRGVRDGDRLAVAHPAREHARCQVDVWVVVLVGLEKRTSRRSRTNSAAAQP